MHSYTYVGNRDPSNTSVAIEYNGEFVSQGESIELSEDEMNRLSEHFIFSEDVASASGSDTTIEEPQSGGTTGPSAPSEEG